MSNFPGRFVGKFAPFPRQEDFRIPSVLYRIEEYERLSKEGKQRLEWIKKKRQWDNVSKVCRYFAASEFGKFR